MPWKKEHNPFAMIILYHRHELGTDKIFATIEYNLAAGKFTLNDRRSFSSFEEATKTVDDYLISQHPEIIIERGCNFYLINKKDIKRFEEKLMVLL